MLSLCAHKTESRNTHLTYIEDQRGLSTVSQPQHASLSLTTSRLYFGVFTYSTNNVTFRLGSF